VTWSRNTRPDVGKRAFDLFWSLLGLALLSPLLALAAIAVKLEDGGPVFYRQERVGRGGRSFRIWKFRTMVVDADRLGRAITVGRDPRITRSGAFLRRAKLDELPQLMNVVVGEMSLVGPRPEVPKYVALYGPDQRGILVHRPGITDLASIKYRNESDLLGAMADPDAFYVREILPDKIRINQAYAARAHVWTDFLVILATLGLFPASRIPGAEG
jgi:lipopolysaccharide/colanic/teichoic acid biosynthesis glycosyltransferase